MSAGDTPRRGLVDPTGLTTITKGLLRGVDDAWAHPARGIRRYVVELLRNAVGEQWASRVHSTRSLSLPPAPMPTLNVYASSESVEIDQSGPRILRRQLDLVVELVASLPDALDDYLDDVSWRIEHVVQQDPSLGGLAADTVLVSRDLEIDSSGDRLIGGCAVTFRVTYDTAVDYDVLPELLALGVKWDVAKTDGRIDAEDTFDFTEE